MDTNDIQLKFHYCTKKEKNVFISDQAIKGPTLLIKAEFSTKNYFLNLLGFKFHKILPINSPVRLKLFFMNLSDTEIKEQKKVRILISYPNSFQSRPWFINIPSLTKKYECCYAEVGTLFKPEVPGNHMLTIAKIEGIQYADLHGVTDRPFKQIDGEWKGSFNVYSDMEYSLLLTTLGAIFVSTMSLIVAVISLFSSAKC